MLSFLCITGDAVALYNVHRAYTELLRSTFKKRAEQHGGGDHTGDAVDDDAENDDIEESVVDDGEATLGASTQIDEDESPEADENSLDGSAFSSAFSSLTGNAVVSLADLAEYDTALGDLDLSGIDDLQLGEDGGVSGGGEDGGEGVSGAVVDEEAEEGNEDVGDDESVSDTRSQGSLSSEMTALTLDSIDSELGLISRQQLAPLLEEER